MVKNEFELMAMIKKNEQLMEHLNLFNFEFEINEEASKIYLKRFDDIKLIIKCNYYSYDINMCSCYLFGLD